MFQDLDLTLQHILDDVSAPADLHNANVSFRTPDKTFSPGAATIDLFLFATHENHELRDLEPIIELDGSGAFVRRRPPIRVDCVYLVTAWSGQQDDLKIQEEHRLLALALAWLSRYPNIPNSLLQGSLTTQPEPPPMWVAQRDERLSLSEFWNALGIPPRAGFTLTVTISMKLDISIPEGPPVVTKEIQLYKLAAPETLGPLLSDQFEIAGTVRDNLDQPITGATVTLLELGSQYTTLADGRFTFTLLDAGNYNLQADAAGFNQNTVAITVPGTTLDSYDIQMSP